MTGSLVFPVRRFSPSTIQARLVGQAINGGLSLSGEAQFADAGGGGRWIVEFGDSALWTREDVLAWRRFVAAADGGAQSLLVPLGERIYQPTSLVYPDADTFGLETWVADASAWTAYEVTAATTATAALGATSLAMNFSAPKRLLGGEKFGALHATWGWRFYSVSRVVTGGAGDGGATTIQIRPPLREAIGSGSALDFDNPRCVMRVDGDISETVELLKFGKAQARFVEYPGPP